MAKESFEFLLLFGFVCFVLFILGYLGKWLKFPNIVLFILAGLLLGDFISHEHTLEKLGEIGIVLLFFYLGLEFKFERALKVAKKIWAVGLLDIFFNFVLIFFIMKILNFDLFTSFLTAGLAYASSSAITTKVIVDSKRIANPETELVLGLMVFEDIFAPIILAVLSSFTITKNLSFESVGIILVKVLFIFALFLVITLIIRDKLGRLIDSIIEDDIFILFILGLVILAAGFTKKLGLSEALGAFLTGILIAEAKKEEEVEKILFPIKDLVVALFFMVFGASIALGKINLNPKLIFSLIVVILFSIVGKFLTGFIGGLIYGLSKRSSATAGFSIINRGEFSIVMTKFAPPTFLSFAGIYVFIMSLIGIIFAQYAPKLSRLIFPKKRKKKKKVISN